MKITSQEEYGLRCLLRLAEAGTERSLTIPEIAAAEGLSSPYVAKLLAVTNARMDSNSNLQGAKDLAAAF